MITAGCPFEASVSYSSTTRRHARVSRRRGQDTDVGQGESSPSLRVIRGGERTRRGRVSHSRGWMLDGPFWD